MPLDDTDRRTAEGDAGGRPFADVPVFPMQSMDFTASRITAR